MSAKQVVICYTNNAKTRGAITCQTGGIAIYTNSILCKHASWATRNATVIIKKVSRYALSAITLGSSAFQADIKARTALTNVIYVVLIISI